MDPELPLILLGNSGSLDPKKNEKKIKKKIL